MGNFYSNIITHGPSQADVATAVSRLDCEAYVAPTIGGWTCVLDRASDDQDEKALRKLASALSKRLQCGALAVMNHDDDILMLFAYAKGRLAAQYVWEVTPGVFEGLPKSRAADHFAKALGDAIGKPDTAPSVQRILMQVDRGSSASDAPAGETTPPAQYTDAGLIHRAVGETLGLRSPWYYTGYYTACGEQEDSPPGPEFMHCEQKNASIYHRSWTQIVVRGPAPEAVVAVVRDMRRVAIVSKRGTGIRFGMPPGERDPTEERLMRERVDLYERARVSEIEGNLTFVYDRDSESGTPDEFETLCQDLSNRLKCMSMGIFIKREIAFILSLSDVGSQFARYEYVVPACRHCHPQSSMSGHEFAAMLARMFPFIDATQAARAFAGLEDSAAMWEPGDGGGQGPLEASISYTFGIAKVIAAPLEIRSWGGYRSMVEDRSHKTSYPYACGCVHIDVQGNVRDPADVPDDCL